MKRPLGDMCTDIARYAASRNHEFLAHLLRIAAVEADVDMSLIMKRFNVGITKIRRLMAAAKREKQI